jgi:hypothetical protein
MDLGLGCGGRAPYLGLRVQCITAREELVRAGRRGMAGAREDRRRWRFEEGVAVEGGPSGVGRGGGAVLEFTGGVFPLPPSSFISPVRPVPTSVDGKVTVWKSKGGGGHG